MESDAVKGQTTNESSPRLVGFLGTGNYYEATYTLGEDAQPGRYTPIVLAQLLHCKKIDILATEQARAKHGAALDAAAAQHGIALEIHQIPAGRSEAELRRQFRVLRDLLIAEADRPLVLDVTLGFRAQPFFAAAGLAALSAAGRLPADTRIFYGAFDAREENTVPVWDLTPFLHMIAFAQAAATFRATGDGRPLADALERERRQIARRAQMKERDFARANLIAPLRQFSEDFAACRVAALVVGTEPENSRKPAKSSSAQLLEALERWSADCDRDFPALVPMLDQLVEQTRALAVEAQAAAEHGLAAPEARNAVGALARLYYESGRLMEAAAVAREEVASRMADAPEAVRAGRPGFDLDLRRKAERRATQASRVRSLFDFRNDLLHAGMGKAPLSGAILAEKVADLVEEISRAPRTIVVSRHPGAVEWLARQGITADEIVSHLDEGALESFRAGDRVIGTLPPQLLAALCERGVRCDLLVIDVTENQRGRELSADDLEAAGARLRRAFLSLE